MSDTPKNFAQSPDPDGRETSLGAAVYDLFDQYCLPQFQAGGILSGLRSTLAYLHRREQERAALEVELQTYRQLALTLQNRLDGAK